MNELLPALLVAQRDGLIASAILLGVVVAVALLQWFAFGLLDRVVAQRSDVAAAIVRRARGPASFALPLIATQIVLPGLLFPKALDVALVRLASIAAIVAVGWTIAAVVALTADLAKVRYGPPDGEAARRAAARIDILSRTAVTLVLIVTAALAAMTFPEIRTLGTTVLASAGVAGILVGLAARPLFENLIAGLQIALLEPIRVDDVVVVEGEQGRIEEIGATSVVVRLVDRRRMVLPLTHFLEKPFENWTCGGTAQSGSVDMWIDFATPLGALRTRLSEVLASTPLWDGGDAAVMVVDANESLMQVRCWISAGSASDLWNLRCLVREEMIAWLEAEHPEALRGPRMRITPVG